MEHDNCPRARKASRRRMEFGQKLALIGLLSSIFIITMVHVLNFILLYGGHIGMAQEVIASINVIGGIMGATSLVAYPTCQYMRNHSANKNGISAKGSIPGKETGGA
jgi:hypothetical protein